MDMEIALYKALIQAGVQPDTAETVVKSVESEIEKQLNVKVQYLATKADIADAKAEIIKWYIGSMVASIGLILAALKMFVH